MTNRRLYCDVCLYPLVTCVCSAVTTFFCESRIEIIQDVSEKKSAKNTARLISLCIPHAKVWCGSNIDELKSLKASLINEGRQVIIVYPNRHSENLTCFLKDALVAGQNTSEQKSGSYQSRKYCMIFLDGTWKKAFKLWMSNDWLWQYPSVHLDEVDSEYIIRKAPSPACLSTIEALIYSLVTIEPTVDVRPLWSVFNKMQSYFLRES